MDVVIAQLTLSQLVEETRYRGIEEFQYRGSISSRFASNSEANASELLKKMKKCFLATGVS